MKTIIEGDTILTYCAAKKATWLVYPMNKKSCSIHYSGTNIGVNNMVEQNKVRLM